MLNLFPFRSDKYRRRLNRMTNELSQKETTRDDEAASGLDLLKRSNLYAEFQREREEILKHKWLLSERAGHDIGFDLALTDWIVRHRSEWRRARRRQPAHL